VFTQAHKSTWKCFALEDNNEENKDFLEELNVCFRAAKISSATNLIFLMLGLVCTKHCNALYLTDLLAGLVG
jgi:hypothetical protein